MAETVSTRELRNDTSGVIDRAVATGGEIIITRHGRPVAALRALEPRSWAETVADLIDALPPDTADTGLLAELDADDEQSMDDL
ncbi:MAG: type II toxin-antitoxin system Phd/YefM family antitoxin [Beutenbergiaceae bacterium]